MDLFKAITGKNPAEYEQAAKILVNTPDIELFKKLVEQDDFLFDFIKNNVAKRIKQACNKDNFKNLYKFLEFDSTDCITKMKDLFVNGTDAQKTYAVKVFSLLDENDIKDLTPAIRETAKSDDEFLSNNSIEVLAKNNDAVSKEDAVKLLESKDEFEQFSAIKFLVTFGAKDTLPLIFDIMKRSSLSENIALEIPFLVDLETLLNKDFDKAILVLCNIVNAIPEIISPSAAIDYNLLEIFENIYHNNLTSSSALLLRMAKEKFVSFEENDEYLFDCDKNTKEEIININKFFKSINVNKLNSLLYDELYEESDFVFFAVDYADNIEELETLLDSSNQTLLLKVLTRLKEKQALNNEHKNIALKNITNTDIKSIIDAI